MGVKLTKIDELDDYRRQMNEVGKLQVERFNIPWFFNDWLYLTFGTGKLERKIIKQAQEFTGSVIATKRKSFISNQQRQMTDKESQLMSDDIGYNKKQRQAMLDTLLAAEQNERLIDSAGIQEGLTIGIAGQFSVQKNRSAIVFVREIARRQQSPMLQVRP